MVELQDAHRVAMEIVEEIALLPERQRNSVHQRRGKIFHCDEVVPHRRTKRRQCARPLVRTMHGKGVERTLVHDHEPFLQVLALLAFVARVLERQVSPKLRRVLDRHAPLLARRQGEKQLRLLDKPAERRWRHVVIADVHEAHVLAGARDRIDRSPFAPALAVDERSNIDHGDFGEVQDAGGWHDHALTPFAALARERKHRENRMN